MADEPNRLNSAQLDADISVLGDDRGGEPKVARVGPTPAPDTGAEGLAQAEPGDGAPRASDDARARDELDRNRASAEARREIAEGSGKG